MKYIILFILAMLSSSAKPEGRDLKLGIINGSAEIKINGIWKPVSGEDKGIVIHLKDSVSVGKSLTIHETIVTKKKTITKSYFADAGKWTVEDIVSGKAYSTNRKPERTGETVKGENIVFFDVLVNDVPVEECHFGDHPYLRVINSGNQVVYLTAVWRERNNIWRLPESDDCIMLEGKKSIVINSRGNLKISPPKGEGKVIVFLMNEKFSVKEAIKDYSKGDYKFRTIYKFITISE